MNPEGLVLLCHETCINEISICSGLYIMQVQVIKSVAKINPPAVLSTVNIAYIDVNSPAIEFMINLFISYSSYIRYISFVG